MNGELYRLKTSRDGGREDTLTHEGREWVGACLSTEWTSYSGDTEILVDTDDGREVVLFADLDAWTASRGVWVI